MKFLMAISCFLFTLGLSGQVLNSQYIIYSDDANYSGYIEFVNDSIVHKSNPYQGIKLNIKDIDYYYTKNNDTLLITDFYGNKDLVLIKKENYFVNYDEKLICANIYQHPNSGALITIIDGEEYVTAKKNIIPDLYSNKVVKRNRKKGSRKAKRKVKRKLKNLNTDDYKINLYYGYEALKKFGYEYIFGVIVFEPKD